MTIQEMAQFMLISLYAWQGAAAQQPNRAATALTPAKEGQMIQEDADSAIDGSPVTQHTRTKANARITVRSSQVKPYDSNDPLLMEIQIVETFSGDIEGSSTVRALQLQRKDKSASQVSLQRFSGTLGGRRGTFVLQGSETVGNGEITATWFVVPGSGSGDLSGLRGEGGFKGSFGKGSDGWLDYWFE